MGAKLWQKAPFIRFLLAVAAGIVLQWYGQFRLQNLVIVFAVSVAFALLYSFTGIKRRYQLGVLNGIIIYLLFACIGSLLVWTNDIRNNKNWLGHEVKQRNFITVTLEEPVVEKANSYKAIASFTSLSHSVSTKPASGKLILYFRKDS